MSDSSYAAAWTRYRRIRLVTILLIVTFPFAPWIAVAIFSEIVGETAAFAIIPVLWIIATVDAAVHWAYFPCPRCGHKFRRKAGWATRNCAECGLLMYATEAEAADPHPERALSQPLPGGADTTYVEAWKKYRRLQHLRSWWILIVAVLVPAIVLPQLSRLGDVRPAGAIMMIWVLGCFLVYATSRWRLLYFRCPRCKRRFNAATSTRSEWCVHCHLRRFTLSDPDAKNALR